MGWVDAHPHEFHVGEQVIAPDWWITKADREEDVESARDERRVKLATVVSEAASTGEFEYLYDMGDEWRHRLVIEADTVARALPAECLPVCTAGENACPPEDVGGPHGYARFLAALTDPEDEDHADMRSWIGGVFDPRGFDLNHVNREWRGSAGMGRSR
jgi:Plasmid pRiA4b ORF-3-like protein